MSVIRWIKETYDRAVPFHFIPHCFKFQGMCIKIVEENPWQLKDVPDKFKTQEIYDQAVRGHPSYLKFIPDHFTTQEIRERTIQINPWQLNDVPGRFKIQEICNEAVHREPCTLGYVSDNLKTQGMCKKTVEKIQESLRYIPVLFKMKNMCDIVVCMKPLSLAYLPYRFKTQKMCDKAVRKECLSLLFVLDWFVTQQQQKYLLDDNNDWYDNKLIEWHDAYQKQKAQKVSIKGKLLTIAWNPLRWQDCCDDQLKTWKEHIKINFHSQDVPYDMYCNATVVLKIDSVYKQGKNLHPQVYIQQCKYTDAEKPTMQHAK